jgi:hypothetical protein
MAGGKTASVKFTANFEENLGSIEMFWIENEFPQGYDRLLHALSESVIPSLERFPSMGRPFFARQAESVEALARLGKLRRRIAQLDGKGELREYLMDEYLLLYSVLGSAVYLLSIKHHKQLSFDINGPEIGKRGE